MLRAALLSVASLLTAATAFGDGGSSRPPNSEPVVVELFESQGCSSCPPANANVNALSARQDVLTLIYGVTYWDQLGWTDTFARPEFTQRQRDYARGLGNDNVYTPQVVLNGRMDLVGNDRAQLDAAIRRAAAPFAAHGSIAADRLELVAVHGVHADLWLARYDPRTLNVAIRAGENDGRTLPHIHVVRELRRLGVWDGSARSYRLPPATQAGLRTAVLIQSQNGGPIVGAVTDRGAGR
ncbi:MAG: DUF1223 domain-containing protein [Proteobacteria bacterium]|nr:DUF1223 domain-containing protein [Pseudomonadota bacterium]